jgi:hypothetical protein
MITQLSLIRQGNQSLRMPKEKIMAYLASMPWLAAWLKSEKELYEHYHTNKDCFDIRQIYVQGIDSSFLDYAPVSCTRREQTIEGSKVYFSNIKDPKFQTETIYFLDSEGKVLDYEVEFKYPKTRKFIFWITQRPPGKDMLRAIARGSIGEGSLTVDNALGGMKERCFEVKYAVSYCEYTKALIVYRPPRGKGLVEHALKIRDIYLATLQDSVRREVELNEPEISVSTR